LAKTGEFEFLARLLPRLASGRGVVVGPGDDCAVVAVGRQRWLITTDALVEGTHFRPRWFTPQQLGRKAYLVNASDIAAMGGRPRYVLAALAVPARYPDRDLMRLNIGIAKAAAETGACVIGGNLTRADRLSVTITLVGEMRGTPVLRRGAQPGDALFVSGELGSAAYGRRLLSRRVTARGHEVRRFREPVPRLEAAALLAQHRLASAMIDVSDGLLQDLGHLCAASGVGARVEVEQLPCRPSIRAAGHALALSGGEDYELLCAVPMHRLARMRKLQHRFGCQMTRIGAVMPKSYGVRAVDALGTVYSGPTGFDHFHASTAARRHRRTPRSS
jgi:thiamine-monophosphate kinase